MADKEFHSVTIVGYPGLVSVFIDGTEMPGIRKMKFEAVAGEAPSVTFTILPDKIDILNLSSDLKFLIDNAAVEVIEKKPAADPSKVVE